MQQNIKEISGYIYDRPSTNLWVHEFAFMSWDGDYIVVDMMEVVYERLKGILRQGAHLTLRGRFYPEDNSLELYDAWESHPEPVV